MSGKLHRDTRTVTASFRPWNITLLVANRRLAAILILLTSLLLFSLNLERPPHPDELYHILAARGLLEVGEPRIAEGLYIRAYPFTWIVAQSFALFGESLTSARLPSVVATALLVAVLFLWLWREAGPVAAWLGAGLYATSPFAVQIAQFSRFYAIQSLFFLIGGLLVYELLFRPGSWGRKLLLGFAAAASFAFAAELQPTTLMGIAAVAAWALPIAGWRWLQGGGLSAGRQRVLLVVGIVLVALVGLGLAWESGVLARAWHMYRSTPLFNAANRNQFWFYHARYILFYPTLWTAVGVLAVAGLAFFPRPGWFALVLFAVAFLLNSFAGPKSLRYIAYAQPFMFVIWGLGLVAIWPWLRSGIAKLRDRLVQLLGAWFSHPRQLAHSLIGLALGFLVLANPFWLRTATVIADIPVPPEKPQADWRKAKAALLPWLERAAVVVDTEELGPLYFLGRHDILYSPSKFGELPPGRRRDFGRDVRTGRPVIGSLEALERVFRCYRSGLFLAPEAHRGVPYLLNADLQALLARYAEPIELPADAHVLAYAWQHAGASASGECALLREAGR